MQSRTVITIITACALVGIATGVGARELGDDPASPSKSDKPSVTATTDAPVEAPTALDDLVIEPGAVGPVSAGMSKADALATGLLDADLPAPVDGCPAIELAWKKPFADGVDVQTLGNGQVVSLGVTKAGPRTAEGVGVGSTLAEVQAASKQSGYEVGDVLEVGFGQAGLTVFDPEAGGWIGYLFGDSTVDTVTPDTKVSFVEVTRGAQPELMRSGC